MQAVILAAGRGSRLEPLTRRSPKCLTELGGRSLLHRCVARLRAAGIERITVVTGYRSDMIPNYGAAHVHNAEWNVSGIAYSLHKAAKTLTESTIVCYGDIVFDPEVLDAALQPAQGCISLPVNLDWLDLWSLRMDDVLEDAEQLVISEEGFITEIGGTAKSVEAIEGQYMGMFQIDRSVLTDFFSLYEDALRSGCGRDSPRAVQQWDMTTLFTEWMSRGGLLKAAPVHGGWLEIDTHSDFELYSSMHRTGQLRKLCRI